MLKSPFIRGKKPRIWKKKQILVINDITNMQLLILITRA